MINTYFTGFTLSLLLTFGAFGLVQQYLASGGAFMSLTLLVPTLILLALLQLIVQMVCFLHVGRGKHAAWNVAALSFALFVVVVIVGGSMWIMDHLHHQTYSPEEIFESEAIEPPHER